MYRNKRIERYCILFGKHLRNLREERKISLKELSDKTKIRVEYLKKIEAGTAYRIKLDKHLYKIIKVLNITFESLFDFENNKIRENKSQ